jgi:hypothetical protein
MWMSQPKKIKSMVWRSIIRINPVFHWHTIFFLGLFFEESGSS